jgi:hypothetical protein
MFLVGAEGQQEQEGEKQKQETRRKRRQEQKDSYFTVGSERASEPHASTSQTCFP